jgi:hypothetical protein
VEELEEIDNLNDGITSPVTLGNSHTLPPTLPERNKTMKKKLVYIEDLARKLDIQKKPPPKTSAYGWLMKEEPPDKTKELLDPGDGG